MRTSSGSILKSPFVITIDGPAASGKTSVSRGLAQAIDCDWVSSGAFYRGLAYIAKVSKSDLDDETSLVKLVEEANWEIRLSHENTLVFFNNEDVTNNIYLEEVGSIASKISPYPLLRKALLEGQRNLVNGKRGLVAEGRDCGTVVFPNADLKFYITARSEDRAQRRAAEEGLDINKTLEDQKIRDKQDSTRKASPLQVPEGSHVVDTSELSLEEVVKKVEKIVREKLAL